MRESGARGQAAQRLQPRARARAPQRASRCLLATPCPAAAPRAGNYFPSIAAALKHSPYWVGARALIERAGLAPALAGKPLTLLVPTNAAVAALGANVSRASPQRLAAILRYHALPGARPVPGGFAPPAGAAAAAAPAPIDTLLEGHALRVAVNAT